jgi:hypothetical protein
MDAASRVRRRAPAGSPARKSKGEIDSLIKFEESHPQCPVNIGLQR